MNNYVHKSKMDMRLNCQNHNLWAWIRLLSEHTKYTTLFTQNETIMTSFLGTRFFVECI